MVGGDDGNAMSQRRPNSNYDGRQWAVRWQRNGDDSDGAQRQQWRRPNERWAATTATLRQDGNATATVMGDNGQGNGYTIAMTAMERVGDGDGAPTSNGHYRGMFARYGRTSVHLELSSFRYKYGTPLPPLTGRLHLRPPRPASGRS